MSFFGKKAKKPAADNKNLVTGPGGKIDELVKELINLAHDSVPDVRQTFVDSLQDISRKHPELVLGSCIQFIKTEGKNKKDHVILLLNLIINILENDLYTISEQLAIFLIRMALSEMTKEKNVVPEWQGPACQILVTVGKRFPQPVWSILIELFPPGTIPHYFVLKTLGDLSAANPTAVINFIFQYLFSIL